MPTKRNDVERDQKVREILDLAEEQLRDHGVDGVSMAAAARSLGVAQNTIRWYFPSRGHLIVATMRRMLEDLAGGKPRTRDVRRRILWWTDRLEPIYRYRIALQAEAGDSSVVADFVEELDVTLDAMLTNGFRGRVPAEDLEASVAAFRATVNGTYAEGLTAPRRRSVLSYTIARFGIVTD
jgi:TetR/AcrR family transcriptional regulator of autoinduction and epiphytic fitness